MSKNIVELNEKNFDSSIKKGSWIVDFWAEWCGPCKIMAPYLEEASKELNGKVKFGKINVEENNDIVQKFEIRSIPTLLSFKKGEVVNSSIGTIDKEAIIEFAEESFAD